MITFRQKGDFSKLTRYLEKAKEKIRLGDLDKYGREGVAALASATPIDTGLTASSWYYEITNTTQTFKMEFRLPLFCNMVTGLEPEVGWKDEIISTLLFNLFLTRLQITHGGRLLNYE